MSPRILLTGFSSFPGVPANPTEALIEALQSDPRRPAGPGSLHLAVLPVEYGTLPAKLAALGRAVRPDIALHFGVSRSASAFVLETTARNAVCTVKPDSAGHVPAAARIGNSDTIPTSLPVARIQAALSKAGLPAVFSDHAGDYLCNYLFYLACGNACPPFAPVQAGFIHVPSFGAALARSGQPFDLSLLVAGAWAACDACADAWAQNTQKAVRSGRTAF